MSRFEPNLILNLEFCCADLGNTIHNKKNILQNSQDLFAHDITENSCNSDFSMVRAKFRLFERLRGYFPAYF